MTRKPNGAVWSCIAAGFLAYLLLPWYAIQDTSWYQALPQVFGAGDAANGLLQALRQGRPWLFLGLAGLVLCTFGALLRPGRGQGRWLLAGGLVGALGLAIAGAARQSTARQLKRIEAMEDETPDAPGPNDQDITL